MIGRTLDGGVNWNIDGYMDHPAPESGFKNLTFIDQYEGWVVGSSGYLLNTTNSGESWVHLNKFLDIYYGALKGVSFVNENEGWVYGRQLTDDWDQDTCIILHTLNGGNSWDRQFAPMGEVDKLFILDKNNIWGFGNSHSVYTKDGGKNWTLGSAVDEDWIFRDIYFKNKIEGFLLGSKALYKTEDGGINWHRTEIFSVGFLRRFVPSDSLNIWILGKTGDSFPTYLSEDGGNSWINTSYNFTALDFVDSKVGYAIQDNSLYRTQNSGHSWDKITEAQDYFSWVSNIDFPSAFCGCVWNSFGVYSTGDSGKTWEKEKRISNVSDLYPDGLIMLNENIGYAVGSDARIYKFESDEYNIIQDESASLPKTFELYQNYPNPFNPETTFEYYLHKSGYVNFYIFNILGQRVETLYCGMQNKGNHRIRFLNQKLPSGLYFYSLTMEGVKMVKKCLLIK